MQIENFENNLINIRNDLKEKLKKNNRTKKAEKEYYEYENNKFYGLKDIRTLFDQNYDDEIYEGIECLFDESIILYGMKQNGLEYEEIKKLMSIQEKNESCVSVIYERIEHEEVIKYEVDYCEVNYYEYEHKQEVDHFEPRPCLIDSECIVREIVEGQKVECCELIECYEVI